MLDFNFVQINDFTFMFTAYHFNNYLILKSLLPVSETRREYRVNGRSVVYYYIIF